MIRQYRTDPKFWGMGFDDAERFMAAATAVRNNLYQPSVIRAEEKQILAVPRLELLLSKNR